MECENFLITVLFEMTGDQSRTLNVGDRVRNNDINDQGTLTEKTWAGVIIKWDNRGEQAILHNEAAPRDCRGAFSVARRKCHSAVVLPLFSESLTRPLPPNVEN